MLQVLNFCNISISSKNESTGIDEIFVENRKVVYCFSISRLQSRGLSILSSTEILDMKGNFSIHFKLSSTR